MIPPQFRKASVHEGVVVVVVVVVRGGGIHVSPPDSA